MDGIDDEARGKVAVVIAAEQYAKVEQEAALDPTQSPDPRRARQRAEDALFTVGRLSRPCSHACSPVTGWRANRRPSSNYVAKRDGLKSERDALASELQAIYPETTGKLVDLFTRIKDFQRRAQQALSDPPGGCDPLKGIDINKELKERFLARQRA